MQNNFLIGNLKLGGYLKTNSSEILLTRIPIQAAQSPESAALEVPQENVGKMVLASGNLSGDVLYSAQILEIVPPLTGALIKSLIDKDIISSEDIQNQLSEIPLEESISIKKRLCALVIGHKKTSPGAINVKSNLTEFDFNDDLSIHIEKKVKKVNIQRIYRRTYQELPDDINSLNPDFIVSLHCNAFDSKTSGTEVLYYHTSTIGKKMAEILLKHLVEYLKLPNRGIKARTAEDRGGYLLRYTKAPCTISEPFFIDNDSDLARAQEDIDGLALAYANAIDEISETI